MARRYVRPHWFVLSLAIALARADSRRIDGMIQDNDVDDNGDHMFVVTFPGQTPIPVSGNVLSNGFAQALSGDYDHGSGLVEVWTSLIEKAYAIFNGGNGAADYGAIGNGGTIPDAWHILSGGSSQNILAADSATTFANIEAMIAGGFQVAIATPATKNGTMGADGIVESHAYVVKQVGPVNGVESVTLLNPWDPANTSRSPSLISGGHQRDQCRGLPS